MFTPTRKKSSSVSSVRKSVSTSRATIRNSSHTSLLRRSIAQRSSLNVSTTSFVSSPTVTSVFGSLHHSIEAYECSIPVLVTEAIALAEDVSETSVKIGENGWSCLVCGQKMLVWSHFLAGKSKIPACKELHLRSVQSSDCYSADLVAIDYSEDNDSLSVLAVSLLGQLIFWPNVLTSTSLSWETKIYLQQQNDQCFNVVTAQKHGYILCLASASLYHVFPNQNNISCKEINKWEGTLTKIGRRVSSFFFTETPQDDYVLQMTVTPTKVYGEYEVLLLTRLNLQQCKCVFTSETEAGTVELLAEINILDALSSMITASIWNHAKPGFSLWPLDARRVTRRGHIALLCAAAESTNVDSTLHYVVCLVSDLSSPADNLKLIRFQHTNVYSQIIESDHFSYELVVDDPSSKNLEHFAMWSNDRVILKSLTSVDGEYMEDVVTFDGLGDRILGAGCCSGRCLFFSAVHGLLTSTSTLERRIPQALEESMQSTSVLSPSTSIRSLPGTPVVSKTRMEELQASEDSAQRMQAAFLHYCRLDLDQAQSMISDRFPFDSSDEALDKAVSVLSRDLLDDYPAQDPRWAESVPRDITAESAGSLILLHQLEDKLKAHNLFLQFLQDLGIWERLSHYTSGRDKVVTRWLLWEHAEKLHASITLLQKHSSHQSMVDAAILQVLSHRENITNIAGLTPRDFFYREVSRIEELFEYLFLEEDKAVMQSTLSSRERAAVVIAVNAVMEGMLVSVRQFRKSHDLTYQDHRGRKYEFIPWTVGSGRNSIRHIIMRQHKIILDRAIPDAEDNQQKTLLYQSLTNLTDLVLDGYQEQLSSLAEDDLLLARKSELNAAYVSHRNQLIRPLLNIGQREKAINLAEKYHDFDILIEICDGSEDTDRLNKYMNKFSHQKFSEFLFRWYLEHGEHRKLLSCCGDSHMDELKRFLQAHPKLAWMLQIRTGDYMDAYETLRYLAAVERDSLNKKKNYLSLSKLAAVFSGLRHENIDEKVEDIEEEHMLIKYQEKLPSAVLESLHQELDTMPVHRPDKLIDLYTGDLNEHANEIDFKKAFELLQYLPTDLMEDDQEVNVDPEEWRLRIWCRLILRDSWRDADINLDPIDACSHTLLLKTLKLAYSTDLLSDILPDINLLLRREELSSLAKNRSFEYLMRATFEQVERTLLASSA